MKAHTFGPWRLSIAENGYKIYGGNGVYEVLVANYVAGFNWRSPVLEIEANARLIAAAPDMLELARLTETVLGNMLAQSKLDEDSLTAIGGLLGQARLAIAKAEGRDSE